VLRVAGKVPRDVVDMQFHQAESEVEVLFESADGVQDLVVFEKDPDEDLGLEFERATWDDVILCNNNCFFCFLKGLPKGMRKTLYMKDDDFRLSFLHGNFVTLTNLTEDDWARLAEQRLSPLNVSVHATELDLRRKMLSNPTAPDIIEQLQRLGTLGIRAHTQIVLCPGVNDGVHLERSVRDLAALHPTVETVSVVPVGASPKLEDWSRHRDGIELVRPDRTYARGIVDLLRPLQRQFRKRYGRTIVQCSDEYYVTAGVRVPGASTYDGFAQYENGIGMVRTMLQDWEATKARLRHRQAQPLRGKSAVVATAALIAPVLAEIAEEFSTLTGAAVTVLPVENTVFGERVNVSGLLCGGDYLRALNGAQAEVAILPRPSLDYFGRQFLDSMPVPFASQWSEVLEILESGVAMPGKSEAPNGAFWSEERETLPTGSSWVPA
jgi:putative radical SAM enzyme (TIGR03279 family)